MKRVFLIFDTDIAAVTQRTAEGVAGVLAFLLREISSEGGMM